LLAVEHLVTRFETGSGEVRAVDDVSFEIRSGAAVGLVGESGSGKSVTALSLLRLVKDPPGRIAGGHIRFRGQDVLKMSERELQKLRGDQIAMIFQEPMTSLNPVYTVGDQVAEVLTLHRGMKRREALARAVALFERVGIGDAARRVDEYPHQLSGGMRQRVMIAMALACEPALLIADEPTTALDVTIQAQILDLLARLRRELGMALLLITHDLGIVAEVCDEVIVMYAGHVVEHGPTAEIFRHPRHPYTRGLIDSIPAYRTGEGSRLRLREIPGMVPALDRLPRGCRFQDRCERVVARCREEAPLLTPSGSGEVRCFVPLTDEAKP
jgi:peptide/nickel transport system ATP-binding protein